MNKKINVLFITPNTGIDGGSFRSGLKLCELLKNEHNVCPIMLVREKGEGIRLAKQAGIKVIYIRYFSWTVSNRNKLNIIDLSKMYLKIMLNQIVELRLSKLIKQYNINLIHINSATINIGLKASKNNKIKSIWHVRELLEEDQHLKIFEHKWINDFKKVDAIIAISDCVKNKYDKIAMPEKVYRIYNGINIEEFYSSHRIMENEYISLLCVGSMFGYKGHEEIIEAIKILSEKKYSNLHMTFVGDGKCRIKYEELIKEKNLQNIFTFEGIKSNVAPFYNTADIVLMCSDFEAFGRVTVEAMLAGCLVIGSDTGATPELLNKNKCGITYKKGDARALSTAIERAINNREESKKIALKGQEYATQHFTAKRNADEVYELYRKLLMESTT